MNAFRLAEGGRIDRSRKLDFSFDGRAMFGYAGDTLASALLANGVHLVGRSFKYHRPRGILAAGPEEPNALVTISRGGSRQTPNLRASEVELYEGLSAKSQNRFPSLARDFGAINDRLSPVLGAGFYYKTFMGPRFLGSNFAWKKLYEPLIRRAAGLGRAPEGEDPDRYAGRFAHCEVLIIGAGEAGLRAALEASADPKARILLCDEQAEMGGALLAEPEKAEWLAQTLRELAARPNVQLRTRMQAFGYFAQNFVALQEKLSDHLSEAPLERPRERLWQVRAGEVVLATGAIERPLVFPDNDRPGILLAGAAKTFLRRYGVRPGGRALIVTACNSAYGAAFAMRQAGMDIAAILDLRAEPPEAFLQEAREVGIAVHKRATILATHGRLRLEAVDAAIVSPDGTLRGLDRFSCDLLAMSGGWTPSVHLFSQSRGKLAWDDARGLYLPGEAAENQRSIGACAGDFPMDMQGGFTGAMPHGRDEARVKAFVDFQNDVCAKDILLATREGFQSIEHVKRYTTTGMATDQGKTSNMNALALVSGALDKPIPQIGLTTFRLPYKPVSFGLFAGLNRGDLFDPVRKTPIDAAARARGAVFEDVGLWKRAHYFPQNGDAGPQTAIDRECRAVREAVGLFDASTLGKIELVGPDAAEFLERAYVNPWKKLEIGRCRYGILCNEAGFVIDDGVIARLASDRFHITTTTGGAPRVFAMFEDYLQTEWPDLKVWQTSTTEEWGVIAVQGPRARDLIAPFIEGIDLAPAAFPHMAIREGRICGVKTRLFRVSFTGELGFEVNVPAPFAPSIWEILLLAAEKLGGRAYGTEAMHVLRAEKGFIIVGQDTDGTLTPQDAGLGWAIGKNKSDFIGKRGMAMRDNQASGRKQLVGLATRDPHIVLEEGAQLTDTPDPAPETPAQGHVTSAYWSANLGQSIALANLANGRARLGETLFVPMQKGAIPVRVVEPVFYDPAGARLDG